MKLIKKKSERGLSYLTFAIFGAIIGAAVYYGYRVIPFYYYFYEMRSQFSQSCKTAYDFTDDEIRKRIAVQITDMEIPAEIEKLEVLRSDHKMQLKLKYREVFDIEWDGKRYDLQKFDFDLDVTEKF